MRSHRFFIRPRSEYVFPALLGLRFLRSSPSENGHSFGKAYGLEALSPVCAVFIIWILPEIYEKLAQAFVGHAGQTARVRVSLAT